MIVYCFSLIFCLCHSLHVFRDFFFHLCVYTISRVAFYELYREKTTMCNTIVRSISKRNNEEKNNNSTTLYLYAYSCVNAFICADKSKWEREIDRRCFNCKPSIILLVMKITFALIAIEIKLMCACGVTMLSFEKMLLKKKSRHKTEKNHNNKNNSILFC